MGKITKIEGGVTAAKGFFSASCMAQIKYTDRLDMAMVYSNSPCVSAGTYTTNLVKAAPVVWDRKITDAGHCGECRYCQCLYRKRRT